MFQRITDTVYRAWLTVGSACHGRRVPPRSEPALQRFYLRTVKHEVEWRLPEW